MSRPPYLRRAAAVLVFVAALAIEFRPVTAGRIPIAASDLPSGTTVTETDVTWLEVRGSIEEIEIPAKLTRSVPAGTPLSAADVDPSSVDVPTTWLRIELEVPPTTQIGATVVAVMSPRTSDRPATGVVTRPPTATGFDATTALVAFSPPDAVAVAHAAADGTVTVLLGG